MRITNGFLIITIQIGIHACAAEPQLTQAPLHAKSPQELAKYYQHKLNGASGDELALFRVGSDTGLALQAAWEPVALEATQLSKTKEEVAVRSLKSAQRFIGFLEGRLKVVPPKWWVKTLLDAQIDGDADLSFSWRDAPPLTHKKTEAGIFTTGDWAAEFSGEQLVLSRGQVRYPIPFPVKDRPKPFDTICLSAEIIKESPAGQLAVAIYGPITGPYKLRCFGENGSKQRWEASVWCMPPIAYGGTGIPMNHFVEIIPTKEDVVIFGLTAFAGYIESFNLKTGDNSFRFGTFYVKPGE